MEGFNSSRDEICNKEQMTRDWCRILPVVVVTSVVALIVGIVLGRFVACRDGGSMQSNDSVVVLTNVPKTLMKDADPSMSEILINGIKPENIRKYLKMLTQKPHLAGTQENNELAVKIKEFWESAGLDHVTMAPYDVMLSYPNMSNLNFIEILDTNNNTVYKSKLTEPILTPEENKTNVVPPFNAYSPAGDVSVRFTKAFKDMYKTFD